MQRLNGSPTLGGKMLYVVTELSAVFSMATEFSDEVSLKNILTKWEGAIWGFFWQAEAHLVKNVTSGDIRGYSQLRDQTQESCIVGRRFTIWATREAPKCDLKKENFLFCNTIIFPQWLNSKELTCNAGDAGTPLGWEDPLEEGTTLPLQYSCLENSMDREAWRTIVHRASKSQTQLRWLSTHACNLYSSNCNSYYLCVWHYFECLTCNILSSQHPNR